LLWPLRARLDQVLARADRRLIRRLGSVAVVLAMFGAGQPLISFVNRAPAHPAPAAVGEIAEGGRFGYWAGLGDARSGPQRFVRRRSPIEPAVVHPSKRTALIVGINRAKGGRPLPGSITDATNMRDALLGYGFRESNITMLLEGRATRSAILSHMDRLATRTPKDGIAVFAVASHTRRRGGTNELLTADGKRISSWEMASRLGKVRAPMWVALPTCYAGGYAIPGITGPNRVATFASPSNQPTYQLGTAGSYLIINMVKEGMIQGRAPDSVEDAFAYAKRTLEREHPNRVPTMSDGIAGDLVLGEPTFAFTAESRTYRDPVGDSRTYRSQTSSNSSGRSHDEEAEPSPTPRPPQRKGPFGVCGKFAYNCKD
jgi:hypothetical protein